MRPLSEVPWFQGAYRRAYEIVALEGRLPSPASISIMEPGEMQDVPPGVMAIALPHRRTIWFRFQPPPLHIFVHELIHLAKKGKEVDELTEGEMLATDLMNLVASLAERGIVPTRNPIRLFEDVTTDDIVRCAKRVFGDRTIERIEDLYAIMGVIPPDSELVVRNGEPVYVVRDPTSRHFVIMTIIELIELWMLEDGPYERLLMEILNGTGRVTDLPDDTQ